MRSILDIDRLLDGYTAYLLLEQGLSDNTRECYRRDVSRLLAWLAATLGATAADYFLPAWVTRLLGGSRAGQTGATVGMLAGMLFFMSVASLILGPFLGAVAGELLHDRRDPVRAVRIGLGSFVSFAVGTGVKLAVCIAMFACTLAEIYPAISEWFSGLW